LKKHYQISILGQDLSVLSDAGDDHVASVVKYVEAKVDQIRSTTSNISALNIAILSALNIADEYIKLAGISQMISDELGSRTENLINLIEDVR
jgi:cell division protein ZapA